MSKSTARIKRIRNRAVAGLTGLIVVGGFFTPMISSSSAASPAAFTTTSDGSAVNANHYQSKCDVYLNGGPVSAALPSGDYVFFVLAPSGQADPNGTSLLSNDTNANRTFTSDGLNVSYTGSHPTNIDAVTGKTLIDLCIPTATDQGYATTPNPGGVYILAICEAGNLTPSGCKYDAFKVREGPVVPTDLTAVKSATPAFTRTYDFSISKAVDRTRVEQSGAGTATFNYSVVATKSAAVDSGYTVSGTITVFNTNSQTVTGVAVTDNILGFTDEACTVTGGSPTITGGANTVFDYTCSLPTATATTTGTNEATVIWTQSSINSPGSSATATAGFDFTKATPTVVGNCTTVTDTFGLSGTAGTLTTLGSPCATETFNYSRVIAIPAAGCLTYDNTARLTNGLFASQTVTVCRTSSNGFTIGYWQNKNGQKFVGDNSAALCTYLSQYGNVLTLPSTCDATTLKNYVTSVIKLANASGTGEAMFRAQFLATALSAFKTPSLATTRVTVPGSLLGTTNCETVATLLSAANMQFATLATNKTNLNAVKDVFDHINNNNQLTC